jgi:hypothetical protein
MKVTIRDISYYEIEISWLHEVIWNRRLFSDIFGFIGFWRRFYGLMVVEKDLGLSSFWRMMAMVLRF